MNNYNETPNKISYLWNQKENLTHELHFLSSDLVRTIKNIKNKKINTYETPWFGIIAEKLYPYNNYAGFANIIIDLDITEEMLMGVRLKELRNGSTYDSLIYSLYTWIYMGENKYRLVYNITLAEGENPVIPNIQFKLILQVYNSL